LALALETKFQLAVAVLADAVAHEQHHASW
jgi:hypothetical protein